MNIAVILAGGSGTRVGMEIPKQFIEVQGKPVLVYTLEAFQNHPEIDAIEVVCIEPYIQQLNNLIKQYNLNKVKWIAKGGSDFQSSVVSGVYNLEGKISNNDILVVHFGASPFVSAEIITDCIRVCKEKGNAISTTPFLLLSGLKTTQDYSVEWIDRDTLVCMNSPHSFNFGFIKDLYDEAFSTGVINEVEPHTTTLMCRMGKPIYFSKGSQTNIKITTKEDLEFFEKFVLATKQGNAN